MGIIKRLFSKDELDLTDLKVQLKGIDRERRQKQIEMRKLDARKASVIDRIKRARKGGNNLEVDYLWEDLNQVKVDAAFLSREARIANRQGILLKRVVRVVERKQRDRDKNGLRSLVDRIRTSGIEDLLLRQDVADQQYLDELNVLLGDLGMEPGEEEVAEDEPEKARFLAAIDEINQAEEAGEFDKALERETDLKGQIGEADGDALQKEMDELDGEGPGKGK
ncbi:MAG: hypothetical protein HY722_09510 [Planctomycetes bacterium]|nr:hypothetical protein [Planctomycetota bacterium]